MRQRDPDWTSEQIMRARQIYRRGGTVEEVMEMLGSTHLTRDGARERLLKLGMRFIVPGQRARAI